MTVDPGALPTNLGFDEEEQPETTEIPGMISVMRVSMKNNQHYQFDHPNPEMSKEFASLLMNHANESTHPMVAREVSDGFFIIINTREISSITITPTPVDKVNRAGEQPQG